MRQMEQVSTEIVKQVAQPVLEAASAELVDLTLHRQAGQLVVRLLVDKVGGVTVQDCARLNRQVGAALDQANVVEEGYALEVSSPGLDRPLVSKRDFERALGEDLELEARNEIEGSKPAVRQVAGRLLAVQHEAIVVTTASGNVTIPFTRIERARKAIRW